MKRGWTGLSLAPCNSRIFLSLDLISFIFNSRSISLSYSTQTGYYCSSLIFSPLAVFFFLLSLSPIPYSLSIFSYPSPAPYSFYNLFSPLRACVRPMSIFLCSCSLLPPPLSLVLYGVYIKIPPLHIYIPLSLSLFNIHVGLVCLSPWSCRPQTSRHGA